MKKVVILLLAIAIMGGIITLRTLKRNASIELPQKSSVEQKDSSSFQSKGYIVEL